jgi:hypothetical protein
MELLSWNKNCYSASSTTAIKSNQEMMERISGRYFSGPEIVLQGPNQALFDKPVISFEWAGSLVPLLAPRDPGHPSPKAAQSFRPYQPSGKSIASNLGVSSGTPPIQGSCLVA